MRRTGLILLAAVAGLTAAGLVPPDAPVPELGTYGAPHRALTEAEEARFLRGRLLFDADFLIDDGVGPLFNGDSCRACHQDPVVGGAGGIDVQVQHPAISDGNGGFVPPPATGDLAQAGSVPGTPREEIPDDGSVVFVEERNSPTLLGLGLVQGIPRATILAGQDPDDDDEDGIFGIAHILPDGSLGRFGWKAQVPTLEDFVRDAMGNELGITVPVSGSAFGFIGNDFDGVGEPEISQADIDDIVFFLEMLDFAPKRAQNAETAQGQGLFFDVGCAKCHVPTLDGVELYSDLLLHDVQPPGFQGVTQGQATSGLYRTPPLRGLRDTAPYFHDGREETIDDAIRRHDGEALAVRQAYEALTPTERAALLAFLGVL